MLWLHALNHSLSQLTLSGFMVAHPQQHTYLYFYCCYSGKAAGRADEQVSHSTRVTADIQP